MTNRISVIIPFYSNIDWLKEAVDSVLNQTYQNFQIILINDGSKEDDTLFIETYKDKINYIKTTNKGPAAARNLGISKAKGEFIAFLDSDDLWHPKKLDVQLKYMQKHNLIWSHTGYEVFDDYDGRTLNYIKVHQFHGDVFLKCLISAPIATPCVMIKTQFLNDNKHIRFADNMRFGQDSFMWLNMARYKDLGVVDQPLTKVRIRGSNAALRARVHIQVKAQMWDFIKQRIKVDQKYDAIPFFLKSAYKISNKNNKLISYLENKQLLSKGQLELLSKILYSPSFLILRIYKVKYNRQNTVQE